MEHWENRREHYNLYYLFAEDRDAHPLPAARREEMYRTLLSHFLQRYSDSPPTEK